MSIEQSGENKTNPLDSAFRELMGEEYFNDIERENKERKEKLDSLAQTIRMEISKGETPVFLKLESEPFMLTKSKKLKPRKKRSSLLMIKKDGTTQLVYGSRSQNAFQKPEFIQQALEQGSYSGHHVFERDQFKSEANISISKLEGEQLVDSLEYVLFADDVKSLEELEKQEFFNLSELNEFNDEHFGVISSNFIKKHYGESVLNQIKEELSTKKNCYVKSKNDKGWEIMLEARKEK